MRPRDIALLATLTALAACASGTEQSVRDDFARVARSRAATSGSEAPPRFDGTVAAYVAYAMAESPTLAASYARWAAATHRISGARRLPDPMVSYGYFIQSVETRVGPQRHRLGVRQRLPWPTSVSARGESAALMAEAESARFEAEALAVERRVVEAYYRLWRVRRAHQLLSDQDELLDSLAESVRARVEIGQGDVADLAQLDLRIERHHDHRDRHHQEEYAAVAGLRAALGLGHDVELPTTEDPIAVGVPGVRDSEIESLARAHPGVTSFDHRARSHEAAADGQAALGLPSFELGFDWIETGDAITPGVQDSGKDPLIVSLGVTVPLWYGTYSDAADAERAEATAARADGAAAADQAEGAAMVALAEVRDSARRVRLLENTLLPQAEAAYEAVLGGFQAGRGDIARVILSINALLEISVESIEVRADHQMAWARLEQTVGRRLPRRVGQEGRDE